MHEYFLSTSYVPSTAESFGYVTSVFPQIQKFSMIFLIFRIHSLIQLIFIEHLLCVKHCSGTGDRARDKSDKNPCPYGGLY